MYNLTIVNIDRCIKMSFGFPLTQHLVCWNALYSGWAAQQPHERARSTGATGLVVNVRSTFWGEHGRSFMHMPGRSLFGVFFTQSNCYTCVWLWYTFTRKTSQICVNRTYTRVQGWTGCHEWFKLAISLEGFTACEYTMNSWNQICGQIVEDLKFVTTIQKFLLSSKHLLKIGGQRISIWGLGLTFKDLAKMRFL